MTVSTVVKATATEPKVRQRSPRELATITAFNAKAEAKGFTDDDIAAVKSYTVQDGATEATELDLSKPARRVRNRSTYQIMRRIHLLESAINRTADTKAGKAKIKANKLKIAELTFALAVIAES